MNTLRTIALLLVPVALAGCAAPYKPADGAPTATLVATRGKVSGIAPAQSYTAFADESCKEALGPLGMFNIGGDSRFEAKITADRRIYIRATSAASKVVVTSVCANLLSFVPEAGATYAISQTLAGNQCTVELLDAKTNAAPPSRRFHDARACR
jgi:hypothetical protein